MSRRLPDIEIHNPEGSCWTCIARATPCDAGLPSCKTCLQSGTRCGGYQVHLKWPGALATFTRSQQAQETRVRRMHGGIAAPFSTLGLAGQEDLLLNHWIKNVSRINLAVDHDENGYRKMASAALTDPGLLNALLALSASHLSRWQSKQDNSMRYLRKAVRHLSERFATPVLARSNTTLLTMFALLAYESFLGRSQWRYHYEGIMAWIRAKPDTTIIDPFILSWLCMSVTQLSLHLRGPLVSGMCEWFEQVPALQCSDKAIDALYGCSVALPAPMIAAAKLYEAAQSTPAHDHNERATLFRTAAALQKRILATRMDIGTMPRLSLTGQSDLTLNTTSILDADIVLEQARCGAEVFRHALHVYVFRTVHSPMHPPTPTIKASIESVFELLPTIPDTLGPGSMLGWALVVIGSEVDALDRREYIRGRCDGLALLELNSGRLAKRVLEEVWVRRDSVSRGESSAGNVAWQQVMVSMRIDIALF